MTIAPATKLVKADHLPDRLSIDAKSPFFQADMLKETIVVRFKGRDRRDVEEYCVSEQWIRVALERKQGRDGRPLTIKLSGEVELFIEQPQEEIANEEANEASEPIQG